MFAVPIWSGLPPAPAPAGGSVASPPSTLLNVEVVPNTPNANPRSLISVRSTWAMVTSIITCWLPPIFSALMTFPTLPPTAALAIRTAVSASSGRLTIPLRMMTFPTPGMTSMLVAGSVRLSTNLSCS